jgi:hypothetical protein
MVGAIGTVLGIDRNASSIEKARHRAMALGLSNVRFEVSELETFDNEGRRYDALIGGAGLSARSCGDVATISKLSGPGGGIAFQEVDTDQISQFPASQLFTRVSSRVIASFKAGGAETNMGSKLLSTLLLADLPRPTMIGASRVESGPDAYAYTYALPRYSAVCCSWWSAPV